MKKLPALDEIARQRRIMSKRLKIKRNKTIGVVVALATLGLVFWGTAIYVVGHFLIKFW